jgi:hypothetical protein
MIKSATNHMYRFERPKSGRIIMYAASSLFLACALSLIYYLVIQHLNLPNAIAISLFPIGNLVVGACLFAAASLKRVEMNAERQRCVLTFSIGYAERSIERPFNEIQALELVPTTSRPDSPCHLVIVYKNKLRPRTPLALFQDALQAHKLLYSLQEQFDLAVKANPRFLKSIGNDLFF